MSKLADTNYESSNNPAGTNQITAWNAESDVILGFKLLP